MITHDLQKLFTRDLNRLKDEILHYHNEENIWVIESGISNSAGNLCLHLIGNLNTYIGNQIGGIAYERNRELEFSLKNVQRQKLIKMIEDTVHVIEESLNRLSADELNDEYPLLVLEERTSTQHFLIHLATHLSYHLGQVNYHRRLIDQKS